MRRLFALPVVLVACVAACGAPVTAHPTHPVATASASESGMPAAPPHRLALVEPVTVPHVEVADLPNEIHTSVSHLDGALVALRILVGSGSGADGAHPGLSEVAALLVQRAYATEAKADPRAAPVLRLEIGPDSATFAAEIPPDGLEPTLLAIGKAMSKPRVDLETLHHATSELGDAIAQRGKDVERVPARFSVRNLFLAPVGRHPYSITLPSLEDVRGLDDKTVRSYFETHYVARNVSLVAVGPVQPSAVSAAATNAFAKLSVGAVAPFTADPPDARPRPLKVMLIDEPKRDPVLVSVAWLGPGVGDGSANATRLYGTISRDRLRSKAGGTGVFRLVPFRGGPSVALLEARVSASHLADAVGYLRAENDAWAKDPSEDELVAAKNEITGDVARAVDSSAAFADALASAVAAGAPETALEREAFEIGTTGVTDVTAAARDALAKDEIVVVVGDAASLGEPLSALGEVDVLDPAQNYARVRSVAKRGEVVPPPPPPPPPPP